MLLRIQVEQCFCPREKVAPPESSSLVEGQKTVYHDFEEKRMGENRLRKHRWALKERMLAVSDGVDEKAELLPPLRSSSRPVRLCRLRSVGCSGQTPNMAAGILTRCFEAVDMPSQSRLDAPARKVRGYYLDGPGSLGASAYCRDDWLGGSRKGKRRKEKEKREKERIVHKIRWRMVALPRTIHQIENCVPGL